MSIGERYGEYLAHFGKTITVRQYVDGNGGTNPVILRHDIDYSIDVALELAHYEMRHGCRSTYYVLHTADYMHDPLLFDKCLQMQDYGHEIGIHLNYLTLWINGEIDDVGAALARDLETFRNYGLDIRSVAAHGDAACYENGFTNYWIFSDLRPPDPETAEAHVTAEGVVPPPGDRAISYPNNGHELRRADQATFDFWSLKLGDFGLLCEASRLQPDNYFSDSGGSWRRSPNPLDAPMPAGSSLVLMHPLYWRGKQKRYYFLSAPHSGSAWLATFLDQATSVRARHEYTLNHVIRDGALIAEKRTGSGFTEFAADPEQAQRLIIDADCSLQGIWTDYAETNEHLERFLDLLPGGNYASYVHLHRDPRHVARALHAENCYECALDEAHPPIGVKGWSTASQMERICWYIRDVNERLVNRCTHHLSYERMVGDTANLTSFLEDLGITVYPRLAAKVREQLTNTTESEYQPEALEWSEDDEAAFGRIAAPVAKHLGYAVELSDDHIPLANAHAAADQNDGSLRNEDIEVTALLTSRTASEPGQISIRNCALELLPDGAHLHAISQTGSAYALLGGGYWRPYNQEPVSLRHWLKDRPSAAPAIFAGGWEIDATSCYTLGIKLGFAGATGRLRVICLTYDSTGAILARQDIALLAPDAPQACLHFIPWRGASRFNLALYMNKGEDPVTIEAITLAATPWRVGRGMHPRTVIDIANKQEHAATERANWRSLMTMDEVLTVNSQGPSKKSGTGENRQEALRIVPNMPSTVSSYNLKGSWQTSRVLTTIGLGNVMIGEEALRYAFILLDQLLARTRSRKSPTTNAAPAILRGIISGRLLGGNGKIPVHIKTYGPSGKTLNKARLGTLSNDQQSIAFRLPVQPETANADVSLTFPPGHKGIIIDHVAVQMTVPARRSAQ